MTDNALLQDFITETGEHLEGTERNLLQLKQQPDDADVLNEIFRSIHTIKGSSEYLGMERIAELSHKLESLLDLLRRGERTVDGDMIDLLMSGNDRIGQLVGELDEHQAEQSAIDDLLVRIKGYTSPAGASDDALSDADDGLVEDEYDEELYGIFIEQLKEGLASLGRDAQQLVSGEDIETVLAGSSEQLATLRSSANYMGYEELKGLYGQWTGVVDRCLEQVKSGETIDVGSFVQEAMVGNFRKIQAMFPKVTDLQRIVEAAAALPEPATAGPVPVEGQVAPSEEPQVFEDRGLLNDFITETGEHLEGTERNLLQLEQQPDDADVLNEIFRSIHTIKGSSEYLGMERIAELSHKLESLLDLLRRGERTVDGDMIDLLMSGNDRIGQLVGELDEHQAEQSAIDDLLVRIKGYTSPAGASDDALSDADDGLVEDEYDEELYGIFIEQLKEGLASLGRDAQQLVSGEDIETVLAGSSEQLATLRSSANYMGYEELKGLYGQWTGVVDRCLEQVKSGETIDVGSFVQEAMVGNFRKIQAMFPKVTDLQRIVEAAAALPEPATAGPVPEPGPVEGEVAPSEEPQVFEDRGLLNDFIAETGEHLEGTERNLLQLEQQPDDADVLNEIFRSIHTIKGSSEYLGMERIAELSHKLESLLDLLRRGERTVDGDMIDLLMSGNDRITKLMEELDRYQVEQSPVDDLIQRLDQTLQAGAQSQETAGQDSDQRPYAVTQYGEEYDMELFAIFLSQLRQGLQSLTRETDRFASEDVDLPALDRCLQQLTQLRSSANYMEYDDLKQFYQQWAHEIQAVSEKIANGDSIDVQSFVRDTMAANIEHVRNFFPDFETGPVSSETEPQEVTDSVPDGIEETLTDNDFILEPTSEIVTLQDFEDDVESAVMEQDDSDPQEDALLNRLALAFDERLGLTSDSLQASFSDDIENDLLSGAEQSMEDITDRQPG